MAGRPSNQQVLELGGQPWPESGVTEQVRSVRRHIPKLAFTSERPASPRIALGPPRSRHRGVIAHGRRLPSASAGVYRRGPVPSLPLTGSRTSVPLDEAPAFRLSTSVGNIRDLGSASYETLAPGVSWLTPGPSPSCP